jgi:hypothetical protein
LTCDIFTSQKSTAIEHRGSQLTSQVAECQWRTLVFNERYDLGLAKVYWGSLLDITRQPPKYGAKCVLHNPLCFLQGTLVNFAFACNLLPFQLPATPLLTRHTFHTIGAMALGRLLPRVKYAQTSFSSMLTFCPAEFISKFVS